MSLRHYCLSIWNLLDPIYSRFTRLHPLKNSFGSHTIMRVRVTKYKGRKIVLGDGTIIQKNDLLLKIHLHNVKLLSRMEKYDSEIRKALMMYKSVQESLPTVAHFIQNHPKANDIKGLIGITMLYKGCSKLGFESHSIFNIYYKLFKKVGQFPIYLLSSHHTLKKEIPTPLYLFMSKDMLYKKYLSL